MSDCFDHAGQAGAQPLGMHYTPHTPEPPDGPDDGDIYEFVVDARVEAARHLEELATDLDNGLEKDALLRVARSLRKLVLCSGHVFTWDGTEQSIRAIDEKHQVHIVGSVLHFRGKRGNGHILKGGWLLFFADEIVDYGHEPTEPILVGITETSQLP